jgi:hypothetical protein
MTTQRHQLELAAVMVMVSVLMLRPRVSLLADAHDDWEFLLRRFLPPLLSLFCCLVLDSDDERDDCVCPEI